MRVHPLCLFIFTSAIITSEQKGCSTKIPPWIQKQISRNGRSGFDDSEERIVGGPKALEPIPWQAHLTIMSGSDSKQCGGTILDEETILTAAHCLDFKPLGPIKVETGIIDNPSLERDFVIDETTSNVKEVIVHPNFEDIHKGDDIAILKLKKPLIFNEYVQAACLPEPSFSPEDGTLGVVSGWGRASSRSLVSDVLRYVAIPVVKNSDCISWAKQYKSIIKETMFCAGRPEGKVDSCQGDSGGPLVVSSVEEEDYGFGELGFERASSTTDSNTTDSNTTDSNIAIIYGIVSFGPKLCGRPKVTGVYTRVTKYLTWISSNMKETRMLSAETTVCNQQQDIEKLVQEIKIKDAELEELAINIEEMETKATELEGLVQLLEERHSKTEELHQEKLNHYERTIADLKKEKQTLQESVETANLDLSNVRREKSDLVDMNENLSNQISEQLNGIKKLQDHKQDLMQKLENSKHDLKLALSCQHHCTRYPLECPEEDEVSANLVDTDPEKAKKIKSAIDNDNLEELVEYLDDINLKNPIIDIAGTSSVISVLDYASYKGRLEIFKNVSSTLKNLNPKAASGQDKGSTPLHRAAQYDQLDIVKYITSCLLNINPADDDGETVMDWAAEYGSLPVVKWYLDNLEGEKNPPQKSNDAYNGRTPLHWAAQYGHLDVVKAITEVIEDKNPEDSHNYTPLHEASYNGHLSVVKYLTQYVQDVNLKTDSYWKYRTPLHEASFGGQLDVVKFLIEKGADPNIKRSDDKTAYDLAVDKGHDDVANYLKQFN